MQDIFEPIGDYETCYCINNEFLGCNKSIVLMEQDVLEETRYMEMYLGVKCEQLANLIFVVFL